MRYGTLPRLLPGFVRNYVLDFEYRIERAVSAFAAASLRDARVLDAGGARENTSTFFVITAIAASILPPATRNGTTVAWTRSPTSWLSLSRTNALTPA